MTGDAQRAAPLRGRRILMIIGGGIAAYKALELIRRLREDGAAIPTILTRAGQEFVTPMSVTALSGEQVHRDLFDLDEEARMGHIQLSRSADLLLVVPATAHLLARMAAGLADDLASTALLATDTPVMVAPAMNVRMWEHPATRRNVARLREDGVIFVGPDEGDMACGEYGPGRLADIGTIRRAVGDFFGIRSGALAGLRALVTSGPTHEPIDPVRYIANRSSGKQGHAVAAALAAAGAETVLVTGPVSLPDPPGVQVHHVETAAEMMAACEAALPADIAVCAAAVADWRVNGAAAQKIKKDGGKLPLLSLSENPDILASLSAPGDQRPSLVVGFAAETENLLENARSKRMRKGCDWLIANDVSPDSGTFGGDHNQALVLDAEGEESWPPMRKEALAESLVRRIAGYFGPDRRQ